MINKSNRVWIDLETTGLNPVKSKILEVAVAFIIDDDVKLKSWVLHHYNPKNSSLIDGFVIDMHDKNGLWDECEKSNLTIYNAENEICQFIKHNCYDYSKKLTLCGASPHFDLNFIYEHMKALGNILSHRVFDVSTLKAFAEFDNGVNLDMKSDNHRASEDIMNSINEYKKFSKLFQYSGS